MNFFAHSCQLAPKPNINSVSLYCKIFCAYSLFTKFIPVVMLLYV